MRTITLTIGALFFASLTQATVIDDDGGPGNNFANVRTGSTFILPADEGIPEYAAGGFILPAGRNVVRQVSWWGVYNGNPSILPPDDFTISIYGVMPGNPDWDQVPALSPLYSFDIATVSRRRTDWPLRFLDWDVYAYTAAIGPIELAPNTTLYLSITNNTHRLGAGWGWCDADYGSGRIGFFRDDVEEPWTWNGILPAFSLSSDQVPVPEPTTAALMGLGLVFLGAWRGRFRSRSY